MLNSRPLTALNDDPTTLNALTPGHFLVGEALINLPDEDDLKNVPENRLNRWSLLQKITQQFWDRWHNEYVSTLINRPKWLHQEKNMKIGDVVIIKEENVPPLHWKLGRVEQIFPGPDELVRSVMVRTATSILKRPIVKLGLLLEKNEN